MNRIFLVFAAIAVILAFSANRQVKSLTKEEASAKVLSVIEKCKDESGTLNSLNPKCASNYFTKFVNANTLEVVMDALQEMFSKQENAQKFGIPSCHIPAHLVGAIAFQKGVTFSQLMKTCPTQCGFGCLHGGFQEMFRESGKNFLEDFPSACLALPNPTDEDLRSCWHITGHGLGEVFGENLDDAVGECMRLPTERSKWHCVSGVRMEYLVGSPDNPSHLEVSADNLIAFCQRFPDEYQDDCFGEAGFYMFRTSSEEQATIDVCTKVPLGDITKKKCTGGGGTAYFIANKNAPEKVFAFCRKYGNKFSNDCLIGVLEIAASEWDFYKNGFTICSMVDSSFKKECLAYFGKSLEKWNGREFRIEACGQVSEPQSSYCMSTPTDPRLYLLPPD